MHRRTLLVALAALAFVAAPASAQLFNVPTFTPPVGNDGVSGYLVDGDGIDLGLQGAWRGIGGANVGARVGFYDLGATSSFTVGLETWGTVLTADEEFPLDVAWTAAGGAAFGELVTTLWVPVGATVGHVFVMEDVTVQPYVHPQVGFRVNFIEILGVSDTDTDLAVQIDLGAEIAFQGSWKLQIAFSEGDADALGIGAAFRF